MSGVWNGHASTIEMRIGIPRRHLALGFGKVRDISLFNRGGSLREQGASSRSPMAWLGRGFSHKGGVIVQTQTTVRLESTAPLSSDQTATPE